MIQVPLCRRAFSRLLSCFPACYFGPLRQSGHGALLYFAQGTLPNDRGVIFFFFVFVQYVLPMRGRSLSGLRERMESPGSTDIARRTRLGRLASGGWGPVGQTTETIMGRKKKTARRQDQAPALDCFHRGAILCIAGGGRPPRVASEMEVWRPVRQTTNSNNLMM